MFKVKSPAVIAELEAVCAADGGVLAPASVVRQAKKKTSALHGYFEWDDTEAARMHREYQARHLIRAVVSILPQTGEETKVYVNLLTGEDGREYRRLVDVLSDEEARERLLAAALDELKAFKKKYKALRELAKVFTAIDEVAA